MFVGFVLGLQGDYVLSTYGSEQALGVLVALSLLRELGPVVTALLFAGRAGTSLTAEIGLMNAGEQLSAMEMMGVDPVKQVLEPRFLAVVISMPLLAIPVFCRGHHRRLDCCCSNDWFGQRSILVTNASRCRSVGRHWQRNS